MKDSFDLISVFKFLLKHKVVIIFSTIVFGVAAYMVSSLFIPKKYTSSVQLYVENKSTTTDNLSSSDITVAQQLVDTCTIIFTSSSVFDALAEDEKIDYSSDELKSMVDVTSVNNTEVMQITVTCPNASDAQYIAKSICSVCISEYKRIISTGSIRAINTPKKNTTPSYPNNKKFAFLGLIAGFVLSCALILLRNVLDTRVKPDDNLAEMYNIPVFAEIMDFENKSGPAHAYKYDNN